MPKSDEQIRLLVENSQDYAVLILDTEGRIISQNTGAERILGYADAEIAGQPVAILYTEEDRRSRIPESEMQTALQEGRVADTRWHVRKDGSRFFADGILTPLRDDAQKLRGFGKVMRDATARKQAVDELRQYRDIFQFTGLGLIVVAPDTQTLSLINPAFARMHGYSPEELIGIPVIDVYAPEVRAEVPALIQVADQTGHSRYESLHVRKDGSRFPVLTDATSVKDVSGQVCYRIVNVEDISEHKQAEQALRQQAELLDLTRDTVIVRDMEDRITFWNRAAEETYRWTKEEVLGRSPHELLRTRFPESLTAVMETLLRTGHWEGELVHVKKEGTQIVVESRWSLQRDDHGNPLSILELDTDITERKEAERSLTRALEEQSYIAETLQRSMLQTVPENKYPGLRIETLYRSALEEAKIGGDFFDVFAQNERSITLVVGDVSGKGLVAAARTAEIQYTLRALLHEYDSAPTALARLNDFVYKTQQLDHSNDDAFIALSLVVVDQETGRAVFATAGTEPTMILHPDNSVEFVEVGGMPIGITPGIGYSARTVALSLGDTIVMTTDGITEARHGRVFFGVEGIAKAVTQRRATAPIEELAQAIYERARHFAGGALRDDACILLARYRGSAQAASIQIAASVTAV